MTTPHQVFRLAGKSQTMVVPANIVVSPRSLAALELKVEARPTVAVARFGLSAAPAAGNSPVAHCSRFAICEPAMQTVTRNLEHRTKHELPW